MRFHREKIIQEECVRCDRCGREMLPEDSSCEYPERIAIRFRAGYGSIFGDGNLVEGDFCQHCLNEVFGKYLRIIEDDPFRPRPQSQDPARKAYQGHQLDAVLQAETFWHELRLAQGSPRSLPGCQEQAGGRDDESKNENGPVETH